MLFTAFDFEDDARPRRGVARCRAVLGRRVAPSRLRPIIYIMTSNLQMPGFSGKAAAEWSCVAAGCGACGGCTREFSAHTSWPWRLGVSALSQEALAAQRGRI